MTSGVSTPGFEPAESVTPPAAVGAVSRALSAIIFFSLLAILPFAAVPYGSVEPWWTGLFNALVFLLTGLWAVEGALSGGWFSRGHAPALPLLGLAAFALLQSVDVPGLGVISFDPYESRLFALRLLSVTAYGALLIRYARTERRLCALAVTVVAVGVASALFGVFRQAAQREQLGFFLPLLPKGSGYAQFINKNHFAYTAEMALGVLLGIVAGGGVRRSKALVPLALAVPVWAALVLSNSRGGLFAMLCQVMFLAATFGIARDAEAADGTGRERATRPPSLLDRVARSKAARGALAAALLAAVIVGTAWVGGDAVADRVASAGEEAVSSSSDPSRAGRKDIWAATWALFEEHPVAGVGLGGYWIAVRTTHEGSGALVPRQAHNDYLELLASSGLVGVLLFLVFPFLFVRRARARLRGGTAFTRAVSLGALAGLFGVAVHSLVDFGLHITANAFVCAALVALAATEVRAGVQKTSLKEY
jgi:O-antigen ligase